MSSIRLYHNLSGEVHWIYLHLDQTQPINQPTNIDKVDWNPVWSNISKTVHPGVRRAFYSLRTQGNKPDGCWMMEMDLEMSYLKRFPITHNHCLIVLVNPALPT